VLAEFDVASRAVGMETCRVASTDATSTATPTVRDLLLRLAGPRAFVRGEAYFTEGRVRSLHEDGSILAGVVEGSEPYRVEVHRGGGGRSQLIAACTCPHGADGLFCKHAVAVALAGLEEREETDEGGLRGWLERQRHGSLVDLLVEAAQADPTLAERLAARRDADAAGPPPPRLATEQGRRSVRRW
jgi:uncharacterized Zn finger protein